MATKFELYKDKSGEFRWRLKHSNGNIIAIASEGYASRASAMRSIEIVRESVESPVEELSGN